MARRRTSNRTKITRREFFAAIREELARRLPPELAGFAFRANMSQIKLYYHAPRIHYEVWINSRDGHIEVALHFEDGPDSTAQLIQYFDRYIIEIKHTIGADYELERWTNSWGRIYQLLPIQPLTEALAVEISERLSAVIQTLQPLLDDGLAQVRAPRRQRRA